MTILVPALLTALNLAIGTLGLHFASQGHWERASWLVFACAFLDGLDGPAARWLKKESSFGKLFDSAVDLISFGILPAAIFYSFNNNLDPLNGLALVIYVSSCLFRLVRFSRSSKIHHLPKNSDFEGLPVTASAGFLAAFLLMFSEVAKEETVGLCLLLALSLLMISQIPFHRTQYFIKRLRMSKPPFIFPIVILLMILILGPKATALAGFSSYIAHGLFKELSRYWKPLAV
ncbi:MAG: hypothetical protein AUJ72_03935 [Candidatus Omnitrophica bacterium CG1_02_46_14]|nr:MAG: hypothetical protein AUJ72_03935 [Candidatus Omnitrophica bacterium CG1_02_46_14]